MADPVIDAIERRAKLNGWTVGTAESCTGGLVSSAICARAGVSSWFQGAVVSYARAVKINVLGVPESLIQVHGEVSLEVARAMAVGARSHLHCDWAISVTGIAGPSGGTPQKPVGTVAFGVAGPGVIETAWQKFEGDRHTIQRASVAFALEFLRAHLVTP